MKKILVIIAAGSFLILSAASCSKSCTCQAKYNDEVIVEDTVDLEDGEQCSDYNKKVSVGSISAELKCTTDLF